VLVDQNRLGEAFAVMRDVHGEAKANYNMGYLLNKKGKADAAEHYFAQALRADPTMAPAQRWLNYLHDNSRSSASLPRPSDEPIQVSGMPNPSRFPAKVITPAASTPSGQMPAGAMPSGSVNPGSLTPGSTAPRSMPSASSPAGLSSAGISSPGSSAAGFSTVEKPAVGPQSAAPPMPPTINSTQRLPPVASRQPGAYPQPQGGAENSSGPNLSAPLPPGMR
jgi:hypothetical protein